MWPMDQRRNAGRSLRVTLTYVIINYDGVEIVSDAVANGGFDLIIVDEATHYKNPQTKRWKTLNALMTPEKWLWMMTGTPAAQSPVDAYGLAKLVNPAAVPRFGGSFRDQVMLKLLTLGGYPKTTPPIPYSVCYNQPYGLPKKNV